MTTLFVRHDVDDFGAWKKVYDDVQDLRDQFGVTAAAVYRDVTAPNSVLVIHEFDSSGKAEAFTASAELKEAMGRAGVAGAPQFDVCE